MPSNSDIKSFILIEYADLLCNRLDDYMDDREYRDSINEEVASKYSEEYVDELQNLADSLYNFNAALDSLAYHVIMFMSNNEDAVMSLASLRHTHMHSTNNPWADTLKPMDVFKESLFSRIDDIFEQAREQDN